MPLPKTFAAGEVFTAADLNASLEELDKRAPESVTSTTRPAHRTGRVIFETDSGLTLVSTGSAWRRLVAVPNDWTDAEAWSSSPVSYTQGTQGRYARAKRLDDVVQLDAYLRPDSGTTMGATGNLGVIFRLPVAFRPTANRRINAVRWIASANPDYVGDSAATVGTDGNVSLHIPTGCTAVHLSTSYRI